ncbi:hypothetical protein ANCCAN_16676 [Ancylostoma caninum]|uniref:Uncharacterized protein n=1 Tax=Ancylostoma caninum TaxID=29170 RepID=A0A368FZ09_ANCCA|nr:hypothetical protein ANCCAN_16676 [Ancylostoma caninum]
MYPCIGVAKDVFAVTWRTGDNKCPLSSPGSFSRNTERRKDTGRKGIRFATSSTQLSAAKDSR